LQGAPSPMFLMERVATMTLCVFVMAALMT